MIVQLNYERGYFNQQNGGQNFLINICTSSIMGNYMSVYHVRSRVYVLLSLARSFPIHCPLPDRGELDKGSYHLQQRLQKIFKLHCRRKNSFLKFLQL